MHASLLILVALAAVESPTDIDFVRPVETSLLNSEFEMSASLEPSTVDVLVLTAPELLQALGIAALDAKIADMIDYTNSAFANSGVPLTMRSTFIGPYDTPLVGRTVGSVHGELSVRGPEFRDGHMTDYGADMLILLKEPFDGDSLCGIATLGTPDSLQDPATVPLFVAAIGDGPNQVSCGDNGIFAHEVGHVLGAGHQRGNGTGAFEFSHAFVCGDQGTATHTAFGHQFYSTPMVQTFSGEPCGVDQAETDNSADNGATIDILRTPMAALRPTMPVLGNVNFELERISVAEGSGQLALSIRRDGDLNGNAEVQFVVVPVTADGTDISLSEGSVFFGVGTAVATINLSIFNDNRSEPDETVQVLLRNPLSLELNQFRKSVTVTIVDDDNSAGGNSGGGGGGSGSFELAALLVLLFSSTLAARTRKDLLDLSRLSSDKLLRNC